MGLIKGTSEKLGLNSSVKSGLGSKMHYRHKERKVFSRLDLICICELEKDHEVISP